MNKGRNKILSPELVEGTIRKINVDSNNVTTYDVLLNLDDGTPSKGLSLLKQSKGTYSRLKEGDVVICLKMPRSSGAAYIIGGKETAKDFSPITEDGLDYYIFGEYGELSIRKPSGGGLSLKQGGSGIKINTFNKDGSQYLYSDNQCFYNSSGFSYHGKAKLSFDLRDTDLALGVVEPNKFGFNFDWGKKKSLGEYGGVEDGIPGLIIPYKNKPIVFNRSVYNHMPNNWQGYDLEFSKIKSLSDSVADSSKNKRNQNSRSNFSYNLDLAPNQIGEVIWGNVFDLDGYSLDSNYNKLLNYAPSNIDSYLTHQTLRGRSIAYHFQVATSVSSDISYNVENNFLASINKEGFLYLNVPSTSESGLIPVQSNTNFNSDPYQKSRIDSAAINPGLEAIPILNNYIINSQYKDAIQRNSTTSKDSFIPNPSTLSSKNRPKGIGVFGFDSKNKSASGLSRVSQTKYHNMYAACETLFANKIVKLNIPGNMSDDCKLQTGYSKNKSFEFPRREMVGYGTGNLPNYMSTAVVKPSPPAIHTGGGVSVCGMSEEEVGHKPLTNDFEFKEGKIVKPEGTTAAGNISAMLNFDGAVYTNIGKDLQDGKSMMLDSAGSMVFWLGKDKLNRSAIIQTDGSVSVNIGGQSEGVFNEGRLDIRVNVNKKGVVGDRPEGLDKTNGDYVISISKSGLVIAGMNRAPMIIRNSGDLCLESTNDIKLIAGGSIIKKEEFSEQKNIGENQDSTTTNVTGYCDIESLISSAQNTG